MCQEFNAIFAGSKKWSQIYYCPMRQKEVAVLRLLPFLWQDLKLL